MNFIENETPQKLRGGYYTPLDLAAFLADWVGEIKPKRILEPSCGDGVFFDAIAKVKGFKNAHLVGFELDSVEAKKAKLRAREVGIEQLELHDEDFLRWAIPRMKNERVRFDAVLGNPPFVRYQYLPPEFGLVTD